MFVFFFCSHWSLVDVPLIFFCPADHVPDWQPRVLLGMVEARSVNVKKTTTTSHSAIFLTRQDKNLVLYRKSYIEDEMLVGYTVALLYQVFGY